MNQDYPQDQRPNEEQPAAPQQPNPEEQPQQAPPPQYNANQQTQPPPQHVPTPARPQRNLWYIIPISLAVGCLPWVLLLGIVFVGIIAAVAGGGGVAGEHIALIRISGPITAGESSVGVFSESVAGAEDIIEQLNDAEEAGASAIVIRLNTPGGSAAGSEEIFNEIMRLRKKGIPVYASMGDVAASGGYYVASACNQIYADASTLTGSIGVIFQTADMSELFNKIGYNPQTIKSGKFKDIGSPARPLGPDERKLIQDIVDETYEQFLKAVAEGRKMPIEKIRPYADGRVFTGSQAMEYKLVDKLGGLQSTIDDAARAGGIVGKPVVVEYGQHGWFETFLGESGAASGELNDAARKRLVEELFRRNLPLDNLR